jgi:protease II
MAKRSMSEMQLAKRIRQARDLSGLSMTEAAIAIGASEKSKSLIHFYEQMPGEPNHVALDESQFRRFVRAYQKAAQKKLRVQTRKVTKLAKLIS